MFDSPPSPEDFLSTVERVGMVLDYDGGYAVTSQLTM
jgi:hypothetical protein